MNIEDHFYPGWDLGVDFAEVEKAWVAGRTYSTFNWLPFDDFSPVNRMGSPLSEARIAIVTTSGAHLPTQESFNVSAKEGDGSFRTFPSDVALAEIVLSHGGYDTGRASLDKNVVIPLDRLQELADDGLFSDLAPTIYSTMGYVAEPRQFFENTCEQVAQLIALDKPDLVLLVPA
ncbi:hypothetical protein BH23CHL5_BH23CHL5_12080 [soil metagenome]